MWEADKSLLLYSYLYDFFIIKLSRSVNSLFYAFKKQLKFEIFEEHIFVYLTNPKNSNILFDSNICLLQGSVLFEQDRSRDNLIKVTKSSEGEFRR